MTDHDQLFKQLLKEFFVEFIELFLPAVAAYLVPSEIKFLDKEVFTDLPVGKKRAADLVARVKFKGHAAHFLIHVEPESSRRERRGVFARRMFDYFALLTRDYGLPVYPVALLSYDKPRDAEADVFRVIFPDKTVLEFRFTVIQLNRLNWRAYLRHDNPVASALMAKMGFTPEERVEVKKECLRMIVRLRLEPRKTKLLATFIDTYLRLNAEEQKLFQAEIEKLPRKERQETMELMTSWEEKGIQIGLQQGRQEGRQEHALELVLRLLTRRLGALNERSQARIQRLSRTQLDELAEALLDFTQPSDLNRWLRQHAPAPYPNSARRKTNGSRKK